VYLQFTPVIYTIKNGIAKIKGAQMKQMLSQKKCLQTTVLQTINLNNKSSSGLKFSLQAIYKQSTETH